jgi:asparagine synthase (glutamine-hydrolysing)
MLDRMTTCDTRGPDARGTYSAPGIAFGVRRLSIVDVDGGQPISDDSGRLGMQNGEAHSHRRSAMGFGLEDQSSERCDTEVIRTPYRNTASSSRALRGKFAVAVWDEQAIAVIARDRLGVKPLYYARAGDRLVFASELKSLLASGIVRPELDFEAIDAYLSLGFVPGPRTPLAGISKLMPGHLLVADENGIRTERYWDLRFRHPPTGTAAG